MTTGAIACVNLTIVCVFALFIFFLSFLSHYCTIIITSHLIQWCVHCFGPSSSSSCSFYFSALLVTCTFPALFTPDSFSLFSLPPSSSQAQMPMKREKETRGCTCTCTFADFRGSIDLSHKLILLFRLIALLPANCFRLYCSR